MTIPPDTENPEPGTPTSDWAAPLFEILPPVAVESPCINVCRIARGGLCEGCRRTRDEIARWTAMTAEERAVVMRALPERRPTA